MKFPVLISAAVSLGIYASAAPENYNTKPSIFIIRHAEKNRDGTISMRGQEREQCLINVFGKTSSYDIQKIIVQNPHPADARSQRPYNTTLPLAHSLGLTIEHECDFDEPECAAKEARRYNGPGNILIAWEHGYLPRVSRAIGAKNAPTYPNDEFSLIYNQLFPYDKVDVTSQHCPGLDS